MAGRAYADITQMSEVSGRPTGSSAGNANREKPRVAIRSSWAYNRTYRLFRSEGTAELWDGQRLRLRLRGPDGRFVGRILPTLMRPTTPDPISAGYQVTLGKEDHVWVSDLLRRVDADVRTQRSGLVQIKWTTSNGAATQDSTAIVDPARGWMTVKYTVVDRPVDVNAAPQAPMRSGSEGQIPTGPSRERQDLVRRQPGRGSRSELCVLEAKRVGAIWVPSHVVWKQSWTANREYGPANETHVTEWTLPNIRTDFSDDVFELFEPGDVVDDLEASTRYQVAADGSLRRLPVPKSSEVADARDRVRDSVVAFLIVGTLAGVAVLVFVYSRIRDKQIKGEK